MMGFSQAIKSCFNKYFVFTGRASRAEYWWFFLFMVMVQLIGNLLHPLLLMIAVLLLFIPSVTVAVRRLHDTETSGWWILIGIIPLIGALVLLYFMLMPGTKGANCYGEAS